MFQKFKSMLSRITMQFTIEYPRLMSTLLLELPLYNLQNQVSSKRWNFNEIPPNVYQATVSKKIGRSHYKDIASFRTLNKDMNFFVFDNTEQHNYMQQQWGNHPIFDVYSKSTFGPMKSDIFRYCIIYDKGGFYFDINKCILKKPIHSFLNNGKKGLISFENNDCLVVPDILELDPNNIPLFPEKLALQWGIGFSKKHEFLKIIIDNIVSYSFLYSGKIVENPKSAILTLTGPGMFTKSLRQYLASHSDKSLVQIGVDFDGYGCTNMKRSWSRYCLAKPYSCFSNSKILR